MQKFLISIDREKYVKDILKLIDTGKLSIRLRYNLVMDPVLEFALQAVYAAQLAALEQAGIKV